MPSRSDEELLNPRRDEEDGDLSALLELASMQETQAPEATLPTQAAPTNRLPELDAIYAARAPQTGPGSAESELLASHKSRPGWQNVLANVGAAIAESTGSTGAIARTHAAQRSERDQYLMRLAEARERDKAGQPVDRGTAELLVMSGMTPEAAASVSRDSQALKLASSGMGQLGARYRQMDLTAARTAEHDANLLAMAEARLNAQNARQDKTLAAQDARLDKSLASREKLASLKKGGKGGGGGAADPEKRLAGNAALLAAHANVTPEQAAAFYRGEPLDLPEETLNRLKIGRGLIDSGQLDTGKAALNTFAREGANPDMVNRGHEAKSGDPVKKKEARDELLAARTVIGDANRSWNALSPKAREMLVRNGGLAPSQLMSALKSARLSDEEQVAAARLQRLINDDIKKYAGSAVSSSEGGRQATAIGLPSGDFNPWQSPAVLSDYLRKVTEMYRWQKKSAEAAFPGLWEGMQ